MFKSSRKLILLPIVSGSAIGFVQRQWNERWPAGQRNWET